MRSQGTFPAPLSQTRPHKTVSKVRIALSAAESAVRASRHSRQDEEETSHVQTIRAGFSNALFFLGLLPPIIFASGWALEPKWLFGFLFLKKRRGGVYYARCL